MEKEIFNKEFDINNMPGKNKEIADANMADLKNIKLEEKINIEEMTAKTKPETTANKEGTVKTKRVMTAKPKTISKRRRTIKEPMRKGSVSVKKVMKELEKVMQILKNTKNKL